MRTQMTAALAAALVIAACSQDPAGVSGASDELVLAQNAQSIAQDVAASTGATYEGWWARLRDTLRTTDDPEARAFLDQAAAYRDSARAAWEAGDTTAARAYRRLAFRSVLAAVIEIYPNAPERTGLAVDQAIVRIERYLGGRDAPRIRLILAHVKDLRAEADRALAAGDKVTALALNLRGMQILHRLVEHIREAHRDHDAVADAEMQEVSY
ncbi:MAG TPA: hypothetical protein VGQ25_03850 [Gemmatimonadales bacterium]|jgi:hypothetical protein|nr:hypothetical protein [Gemmatimonadales bacterium]